MISIKPLGDRVLVQPLEDKEVKILRESDILAKVIE